MNTWHSYAPDNQLTLLTLTLERLKKLSQETFLPSRSLEISESREEENLRSKDMEMFITMLSVEGQQKELNRPIRFKINKEEDGYVAENDSLNIVVCGDTQESVLKEAESAIQREYRFYSSNPESELTGLAIKLKKIYSELF